ncbi:MAG: tetratricopeptide repeat protein [Zetaproteobacteria bacterium]|nr:tetratricopeptide repeat protein [Zetaproteobacteria bacterium]
MQSAYVFAKKYGSVADAVRSLERQVLGKKKQLKKNLILARLYLLVGRPKDAIARTDFVERFDYRNKEAKLVRANAEFANGRFEKASLILKNVASTFKLTRYDLEEVLNLSAGIAQRRGQISDTVTLLRRALKVSPGYLATHFNLSLIYLQHQEYDDAIKHLLVLKKALKNDFYVDVNLGAAYSGKGDYRKAVKMFDGIDALYDQRHYLYYNYALLEYRRHNYPECFEYLSLYLETSPKLFVAKRKVRMILDDIQITRLINSGVPEGALEGMLSEVRDLEDQDISSARVDLNEGDVDFSSQYLFTNIGYFAD